MKKLIIALFGVTSCTTLHQESDMMAQFSKCIRIEAVPQKTLEAALIKLKSQIPHSMRNTPAISGPFLWGNTYEMKFASFEVGFDKIILMDAVGDVFSDKIYYFSKSGKEWKSAKSFWREFL